MCVCGVCECVCVCVSVSVKVRLCFYDLHNLHLFLGKS